MYGLKNNLKILLLIFCLFISVNVFAQGAFQNLGFDLAKNIPTDGSGTMSASDALPGWTCYAGTNLLGYAAYDNVTLDLAFVGIQDSASQFLPAGLLVGRYCLSLQYGVIGSNQFAPASISQTGLIPSIANSIQFRATDGFTISFNGVDIPLVVLSSQAEYNVYGGDVSQLAGQTGQLFISSYNHFGYLDSIQFSTQSVPEPNCIILLTVGLGVVVSSRLSRTLT
jgi:hypothetical protein